MGVGMGVYLQLVQSYHFCPCNSAITVRFEEEMYMAFESDGMVSVTILASSPALFSYNIIVTAMDIEAIRKYWMYVRMYVYSISTL